MICGRSGLGKSTLLRQLKTVLAPVGKSEGEIFYGGCHFWRSITAQSQEIGFVMQNPDNQIVTDKVWHGFPLDWKAWDMTMRLSGCGLRRWPAILVSISGFIQNFFRAVRRAETDLKPGCNHGNASIPFNTG